MSTKKLDGRQSQRLTRTRKTSLSRYGRAVATDFVNACLSGLPAEDSVFQYAIADSVVEHRLYGPNTIDFLHPALKHLDLEKGQTKDLAIISVDGREVDATLPTPFWSWSHLDAQGFVQGLQDAGFTAHWDAYTDTFRILDHQNAIAIHWMRDLKLVPFWERSFPLRKLLSWWFKSTAFQPLHAAAVSAKGKSLLITAKGGSGKSTTALNCLLDGMDYLGDDFVIVNTDLLQVFSLYNVVKLTERDLGVFGSVKINPEEVAHAEDQEKVQVFLSEQFPDQIIRTADLTGIVVPRICDQAVTDLSPCPDEDAIGAIATSTLYLLKGSSNKAMQKITKLVERRPCFYLNLGRDFNTSPAVLRTLLSDLTHNG